MAEVFDRRAALEEAFESAEADARGEEYVPPVRETAPEPEAETQVEEPVSEDPAKVEAKATEKTEKERPRTRGVPPDERGKPVAGEKPAGEEVPKASSALDKAPISWGATRNELWNKVPAEVRAVITKREAEIQAGMSQAGRVRQIADEYHSIVMPFENVMKQIGTTPKAAITNLLQTGTAMIVGTQAQKCAVLTEMIHRYGVDVKELDGVLQKSFEDKKNGKGIQPIRMAPPIDPRLQPLFAMEQRLREAEGQKAQRIEAEAAEAINSVANEQYFEDVRDDMADIMQISAQRGVIMTVQQAYQKAIQINPEISKLISKNPRARTPADAVAGARKRAATVRGTPGGPVSGSKMDRRAQIEAAWDSV